MTLARAFYRVTKGNNSPFTIVLNQDGIIVSSEGVTRCDLNFKQDGIAGAVISSSVEPTWFALEFPTVYEGIAVKAIRVDLIDTLQNPGRYEVDVYVWDAVFTSGRFAGTIDLQIEGPLSTPVGAQPMDLFGNLRLPVLSPAQLTANQNNYAPGTEAIWRLSSDATRNITGILYVADGIYRQLVNVGVNDIVVTNEDVASSAANRIITANGKALTLHPGDTAVIFYDPDSNRWREVHDKRKAYHRITAPESTSGLTEADLDTEVEPYGVLRYGDNDVPGTTVMDTAFQRAENAIQAAGAGTLDFPAQIYNKLAPLTFDTLNLTGSFALVGKGSQTGGSVLQNTTNDVEAIVIDGDILDQVSKRIDRSRLENFRIHHEAPTKYAIRGAEAPYMFGKDVVIKCNSLGFGGVFLGSDTVIPDSDNFLSDISLWDIRDYTGFGLRINSKGHTFHLHNLKVGGAVAGGVAGYFNTEGVHVFGGQWGNNALGGSKALWWYNLGAGDIESGSAHNIKMEGCQSGQYAVDIDGATNAFYGVLIENVGANLIGNQGTIVRFGRAKWCKYENMAIRSPTGTDQGAHTGAGNAGSMTDASKSYTTNQHAGKTIHNLTDGSHATIISNTSDTVVGTLAGGIDNDWDVGDKFIIGGALAEWGEFSIGCEVECSYNAATAPIIVHPGAVRGVKRITNTVARSQVQNVTVSAYPGVITLFAGGVTDLPIGFLGAHNGVSYNFAQLVLADDTAAAVRPPKVRGRLRIMEAADNTTMGELRYDTVAGTCTIVSGGADLEVSTGVLTGTSGNNNKVTVSAATNGFVYVEARKGADNITVLFEETVLGV